MLRRSDSPTTSSCLDRLRHVEVDHSLHTLDVQAAPSHVGGHQNVVPSAAAGERLPTVSMNAPVTLAAPALLEGVHGPFSLLLQSLSH